jgi:hypothetical protein
MVALKPFARFNLCDLLHNLFSRYFARLGFGWVGLGANPFCDTLFDGFNAFDAGVKTVRVLREHKWLSNRLISLKPPRSNMPSVRVNVVRAVSSSAASHFGFLDNPKSLFAGNFNHVSNFTFHNSLNLEHGRKERSIICSTVCNSTSAPVTSTPFRSSW